MASLTFLDPACGSGNFLTETYISLRKLEDQVLLNLMGRTYELIESETLQIRVSIKQFYGIEINDFAVDVAKTALWIAEYQCLQNTLDMNIPLTVPDTLPLKANDQIMVGNALRMDWDDVVHHNKVSFIMGNPPFIGFTYMSSAQKEDMNLIFPNVKNLDYVCAWYKKASDFMMKSPIDVAFVSTNSIVQGETVARFVKFIPDLKLIFAYKPFIWDSETKDKAQVHCVIIGFSKYEKKYKRIYDSTKHSEVNNINWYLYDFKNLIIESRPKPLSGSIPLMCYGNKPADGGNLIVEKEDFNLFSNDKTASKYLKKLTGAIEFLHNKQRWCLWLTDATPSEIKKSELIYTRVRKCAEMRKSSKATAIQKFSETPHLFAQITQPEGVKCILIPRVSSEKRIYVPMGFIDSSTKVTDSVQLVANATIYDFGILESIVHMAWMRVVAGRLKSDYRYSKDIVYNNFVWVKPTKQQRANIEKSAQAIIDARNKYPDSSLAELYDETCMPVELRKAHHNNDQTVLQLYGLAKNCTEDQMVARMFELYEAKISGVNNTGLELL